MSASSVGTQSSFAFPPDQNAPPTMNNPTPQVSSMPSIAAAGSNNPSGVPLFTPPQTPGYYVNGSQASGLPQVAGAKRESITSAASDEGNREKRRRIAPTLISEGESAASTPAQAQPLPAPPSDSGA